MALNQLEQSQVKGLQEFVEERTEWQKPDDWIDIRSGALANSVYYLIGHSADYTLYPEYAFYAETTDNTQTFDVYVDGAKLGSYASGSTVTLDWATLALETGFDVTYPTALRTHIVRVTPTEASGSLKQIYTKDYESATELGVLWAHFTFNTGLLGNNGFLGRASENPRCSICEAVTTSYDCLKFNAYGYFFSNCTALKTVPVLDGSNFQTLTITYNLLTRTFRLCAALRKITLQNMDFKQNEGGYARPATQSFNGVSNLKTIKANNCKFLFGNYAFGNCNSLESLPEMLVESTKGLPNSEIDMVRFIQFENSENGSLKPFQLDFSQFNICRITIEGNPNYKIPLKSFLVNPLSSFYLANRPETLSVIYTDLNRVALVNLFKSMPTVSAGQICNITGTTGAADLTAEDLAIATSRGWTITR